MPLNLPVIQLPTPKDTGTTPVFAALARRKTTREISNRPISAQDLSNLLWAACGVNRPAGPHGIPGRTAASASNSQEIDVYVALEAGVYLYEAIDNQLSLVKAQDLRAGALTPGQRNVAAKAPVQLIFDTGIIAGNVYLFAAARGLAAWFHGCHRTDLARRLELRADQRVLFAQSVGYSDTSAL
jgi:Nitroreductase family